MASSLHDDNKNRICVYLLCRNIHIFAKRSEAKVSFTKTRELWEISKMFQTLYLATSINNVYRALWRGRSCWAIFGSNEDSHVVKWWGKRRPSKKEHTFLLRISIKKKAGGFFLFIISYCMLSLHIIAFPQGYVGPCVPCLAWDRIRTQTNAISLFWVFFVWDRGELQVQGKSDACWFLLIKTLLIASDFIVAKNF